MEAMCSWIIARVGDFALAGSCSRIRSRFLIPDEGSVVAGRGIGDEARGGAERDGSTSAIVSAADALLPGTGGMTGTLTDCSCRRTGT